MTAPSPAHIAARLALACGLDWGRCRHEARSQRGITDGVRCSLVVGHSGGHVGKHGAMWPADSAPVPDPLDADAYLADCRRRGVEPGPLPALSWAGGEVSWGVDDERHIAIYVGPLCAERFDPGTWDVGGDGATAEQLATLARLVAAADGAAR